MLPIRRFAELFFASLFALATAPAFAQPDSQPIGEGRSSLGPANRAAWVERVTRAQARYEAFALRARLSLHPRLIEPGAPPPPHSSAAIGIWDDPTLRPGDVVVIPAGLMIFRGSARLPHTFSDFAPITLSAARGTAHMPELIELQRAHRLGGR